MRYLICLPGMLDESGNPVLPEAKYNKQGIKITGVDEPTGSSGVATMNIRGIVPSIRMEMTSSNVSIV